MVEEIDPKNIYAYLNLGNTLDEQNKHEEALAEYRKAIAARPDYAEAHCNLGRILQRQGHFSEALAVLPLVGCRVCY